MGNILTPAKVTVIGNIQKMSEICGDFIEFKDLEILSLSQLQQLQERWISEYNKVIKRKNIEKEKLC